jgi:hypothetical protein
MSSENKYKKSGSSKKTEKRIVHSLNLIKLKTDLSLKTTDEMSVALEIQERHKLLRMKKGISKPIKSLIKELSHPDMVKKNFKRG